VFPVRYELNLYMLFRRNSVFKGLSKLNMLTAFLLSFVICQEEK
jgi:hypothetical protein